jgi:hypothetical protein
VCRKNTRSSKAVPAIPYTCGRHPPNRPTDSVGVATRRDSTNCIMTMDSLSTFVPEVRHIRPLCMIRVQGRVRTGSRITHVTQRTGTKALEVSLGLRVHILKWKDISVGVWQGVAMDSLKFHPAHHGLPFTALRADHPLIDLTAISEVAHRTGGLWLISTRLDTPCRTPMSKWKEISKTRVANSNLGACKLGS